MEDFTFARPAINRDYRDKYPWDEWIGTRGHAKIGKSKTLIQGRDFDVKLPSVRQAAFNAARGRFIKISTEKKDATTLVIYVLGNIR